MVPVNSCKGLWRWGSVLALLVLVCTTPAAVRSRAVTLLEEGYSARAAAKKTGLDTKTVRKWARRNRDEGSLEELPRRGRKRAFDEVGEDEACKMLLSNRFGGTAGTAAELRRQGYVSKDVAARTALRAAKRAAKRAGFRIRMVRGKPQRRLSASNMSKRIAFARANLSRDWSRVLFTDRKKFYWRYPGEAVGPTRWVRQGERWEAAQPTHPQNVNVYCGLSMHGLCRAHVVAGTSGHATTFTNKKGVKAKGITHSEYGHVVAGTLCPEGQRLLGGRRGTQSWVLQQDNDPSHRAAPAAVAAHNKAYDTHISLLLNWPPNSPDLNPIENVWAYVQRRVDSRGCSTFSEFKQAVVSELAAVPHSVVDSLYKSMKTRLQEVINQGGVRIQY